MKQITRCAATLFFAAATLYGCVENDIQTPPSHNNPLERPETTGVPVSFGASQTQDGTNDETAKFLQTLTPKPGTRTQHADWKGGTIQWTAGDSISIVQVAVNDEGVLRKQNALTAYDYTIPAEGNGKTLVNTIAYKHRNGAASKVDGDKEMEWYAGAKKYHFMATYPTISADGSTGIISLNPAEVNKNVDTNTRMNVKVKVQTTQACLSTSPIGQSTTDFVATPDMKYNYMVGWQKNRPEGFTQYGETVQLLFKPVMTCLWVKVHGTADKALPINGMRVEIYDANDNRLQLPETITLSCQTVNYGNSKTGVTCTKVAEQLKSGKGTSDIYVTLPKVSDKPFEIPAKGSVSIPVFLPPFDYKKGGYYVKVIPEFVDGTNKEFPTLSDNPLANERLQVENTMAYNLIKSKIIGKNATRLAPGTKVFNSLSPVAIVEPWKWMSYLPDTAPIKQLSIPGAHRALIDRRHANLWHETIRKPEQYWDIYEMMYAGIRALDLPLSNNNFLIDGPMLPAAYGGSKTWDRTSPGTGNNIVWCDTEGNITKGYEVYKLLKFLRNNPRETVILIHAREAVSNAKYSHTHHAYDLYLQNLAKEKVPSDPVNGEQRPNAGEPLIVPFKDNLTLGECRGRLIVLVRPESKSDDSDSYGYLGDYLEDVNGKQPPLPAGIGGISIEWRSPVYSKQDYYHGDNENAWIYTYNYRDKKKTFGRYDDTTADVRPATRTATITSNKGFANLGFFYAELIGRHTSGTPDTYTTTDGKTYSGFDELEKFHALWAVDFLRKTMFDPTVKYSWMINVLPGLAVKSNTFDNDDQPYDGNTWTRAAEFITPPVYQYLKDNLGQRAGIVFMDYCPGITNWKSDGSFQYHIGASNKYEGISRDPKSHPPFTPSTYLTNLLIRNNFLYDTTK